jgi:hypothetical protein
MIERGERWLWVRIWIGRRGGMKKKEEEVLRGYNKDQDVKTKREQREVQMVVNLGQRGTTQVQHSTCTACTVHICNTAM